MIGLPLKFPQVFRKLGIEAPKGLLLHGPHGTGKTLLAKALANEAKANFILINLSQVLSKWIGEAENKISQVFKKWRESAPCILFFDEIDSLSPKRGIVQVIR